jgi:hypothetical protein
MKINVSWIGRSPIDFAEPQHAAAFLRILFDVMERVEPLADFQFVLAGELCIAEYEVLVETEVEPLEKYVCVRIGFTGSGCGPIGRPYITEDGRPGTHFELERDDFKEIVLDSDAISWRT